MNHAFYLNKNHVLTPDKILSNTERESLISICEHVAKNENFNDRRNSLMILLALFCGLRASELRSIKIKNIDFEEAIIYIDSLKGSNKRVLPVAPKYIKRLKLIVLETYKADRVDQIDKNKLAFPISYSRLDQIWRFYRPNHQKVFHSLRHSFALDLYLKTKDIKLVQNALGHRSIGNTMIYVDYCYSNKALRKAMVG